MLLPGKNMAVFYNAEKGDTSKLPCTAASSVM